VEIFGHIYKTVMRRSQFTLLVLSAAPLHTEWRAELQRRREKKDGFKRDEINIMVL